MKINGHVVFSVLFCLGCLSAYPMPMVAYAQSPGASSQPAASLPAYIWEGPVPGGYITGYVLDENGTPVPGATISLLQDGELWKPDKYSYPPYPYGVNPQTTRITYHDTEGFLQEGSFLFGLPIPDEYTLTAEKDGHKGSANAHVGSDTRVITLNITLSGYHQPKFTPEQLSRTGIIAGEVRTAMGFRTLGVNVSLWQDGEIVKMPNNPQSSMDLNYSGKTVDYIFEHLAPGRYAVRAEYFAGDDYNDIVTVNLDTRPMRADIVLSHAHMWPSGIPIPSFTPTVGPFNALDQNTTALPSTYPRASPAQPVLIIFFVIAVVAFLVYKKNEKN